MFRQQVVVLRNVLVIKIRDAEIEQDVQQEGKVEDGIIKTILLRANCILYANLHSQYPKWLDEQVE
jgi:hypothetical protein